MSLLRTPSSSKNSKSHKRMNTKERSYRALNPLSALPRRALSSHRMKTVKLTLDQVGKGELIRIKDGGDATTPLATYPPPKAFKMDPLSRKFMDIEDIESHCLLSVRYLNHKNRLSSSKSVLSASSSVVGSTKESAWPATTGSSLVELRNGVMSITGEVRKQSYIARKASQMKLGFSNGDQSKRKPIGQTGSVSQFSQGSFVSTKGAMDTSKKVLSLAQLFKIRCTKGTQKFSLFFFTPSEDDCLDFLEVQLKSDSPEDGFFFLVEVLRHVLQIDVYLSKLVDQFNDNETHGSVDLKSARGQRQLQATLRNVKLRCDLNLLVFGSSSKEYDLCLEEMIDFISRHGDENGQCSFWREILEGEKELRRDSHRRKSSALSCSQMDEVRKMLREKYLS